MRRGLLRLLRFLRGLLRDPPVMGLLRDPPVMRSIRIPISVSAARRSAAVMAPLSRTRWWLAWKAAHWASLSRRASSADF